MTREHRQMITQQVLYGMVLPAAIYAVASHYMSSLAALVVASMLPVTDVVKAKVRGRKASAASLGFLGGAVVTSVLGLVSSSPLFILLKAPAMSAAVGMGIVGSALIGRPILRTLAVCFAAGSSPQARGAAAELWASDPWDRVFALLSAIWGILFLVLAAVQTLAVLSFSPGVTLVLLPPLQFVVMGIGAGLSLYLVHRAGGLGTMFSFTKDETVEAVAA
jgi:hypothetical protein